MGLLLSILVACVGVVEVIACVRHFQNGYLPLWTSNTTNLYEHWRAIPNRCFSRNNVSTKNVTLTNEISTRSFNHEKQNGVKTFCDSIVTCTNDANERKEYSHILSSPVEDNSVLFSGTSTCGNETCSEKSAVSNEERRGLNCSSQRPIESTDICVCDNILCSSKTLKCVKNCSGEYVVNTDNDFNLPECYKEDVKRLDKAVSISTPLPLSHLDLIECQHSLKNAHINCESQSVISFDPVVRDVNLSFYSEEIGGSNKWPLCLEGNPTEFLDNDKALISETPLELNSEENKGILSISTVLQEERSSFPSPEELSVCPEVGNAKVSLDITSDNVCETRDDKNNETIFNKSAYPSHEENDFSDFNDSVSPFQTNEFSKKEMALKRKRSYKNRKSCMNTEGSSLTSNSNNSTFAGLSDKPDPRNTKETAESNAELSSEQLVLPKNVPLRKAEDHADGSFQERKNIFEDNDGENIITINPPGRNSNELISRTEHCKLNNAEHFSNKILDNSGVLSPISFANAGATASHEEHMGKCKAVEEKASHETSSKEAFWLIFSGEYTKALSKDWHSGHFCCWQCDESLTGQRYVLRDEHPYCIKCYESVFANVCEECNKIIGIDSKDLSYKDKHWHEACFLCNKCHVSLVDKQFGSKADKIYCGNCYDTQFASRCDGCGDIFRAGTKKMEYKTRQWHEKCFCCCVCKTPIGTKSFIPREQEIYCASCYEEKFATRCVKCNKIITSGGVTYKNEPWHRECFTCTHCNTSLAGQRFTSRDEKPYCAECFGELFAKRCTSCSKPITGIGGTRFISFEDRHWHNDCFICASCKTSLVGRGFITDGDDIICPECAKQKLM